MGCELDPWPALRSVLAGPIKLTLIHFCAKFRSAFMGAAGSWYQIRCPLLADNCRSKLRTASRAALSKPKLLQGLISRRDEGIRV